LQGEQSQNIENNYNSRSLGYEGNLIIKEKG